MRPGTAGGAGGAGGARPRRTAGGAPPTRPRTHTRHLTAVTHKPVMATESAMMSCTCDDWRRVRAPELFIEYKLQLQIGDLQWCTTPYFTTLYDAQGESDSD